MDDDRRLAGECFVGFHEVEHLGEIAVDRRHGLQVRAAAPAEGVAGRIGVAIVDEAVLKMVGGHVGQKLLVHARRVSRRPVVLEEKVSILSRPCGLSAPPVSL